MHRASAAKQLLASRDDVWAFASTPGRLSDWWPGIVAAQATLTIEVAEPHETAAERLEEFGLAKSAVLGPSDDFAASLLDRLYDLCQTGADG